MHHQTPYPFTNWARNQSCLATSFFQPDNERDIIQIFHKAQAEGKKVRAFGTGHSWSSICLSNDYLLNLDRMQQVICLDREKKQITVQAGIKLWQLNQYLYSKGYSLKNLGSVSVQSVAGAISTATHGSGIHHQIMASQVDSFKIITPTGNTITLQKEKNTDLFHLALVGLGCLGIISEITLSVDERYHLHEIAKLVDFEEACDHVLQWIHECDHLKLWWFPHTDRIMVYRYNRTQQSVNDSPIRQFFFDKMLASYLFRFLIWWGNQKIDRRPSINKLICNIFLKDLNRIEKNWKVLNVPMPPLHRETEWAFDLRETPRLMRSYRSLIEQGKHKINFIQEIRFVKGDKFALSPCFQRDTVFFGIYQACNTSWNDLMADVESWAKQNNGRPHWGKEFTPDRNYLLKQYPMLEAFNNLRKELDPNQIMMNKFTESFLR